MGNTGYKSFAELELYYTDDGSSTGQPTKPNVVTDPDYIAPVLDTVICTPSVRYYNVEKKLSAIKNNCSSGYIGSNVVLTAYPNQFVSTISIADANAQAEAWLIANVQIYANGQATCELTPLPSSLTLAAARSIIFAKQASTWGNCRSANAADYSYQTNKYLGAGNDNSVFYLNRYRGLFDTSLITRKPKSAKIKFKFSQNTVGVALTFNLFTANTIIPVNQDIQLSDWNDWNSESLINSVVVPANSTAYNEISLTSSQINLLYLDEAYDFYLISNGDKNNLTPSTNDRPELSIQETTGEIYLECQF